MRVFLALPIPPGVAGALAALVAPLGFGHAVSEENLHLTLAFLGDLPDAQAEAAHEAIASLRAPSLRVELAGLNLFGGRRPESLHIGLADPAPVVALHARVLARLHGAGVMPARERFAPHVTVVRFGARLAAGDVLRLQRFMAERGGARLPAFAARAMVLYRSQLGNGPPVYHELARYALGAGSFDDDAGIGRSERI